MLTSQLYRLEDRVRSLQLAAAALPLETATR
jgi:hypothetical protein